MYHQSAAGLPTRRAFLRARRAHAKPVPIFPKKFFPANSVLTAILAGERKSQFRKTTYVNLHTPKPVFGGLAGPKTAFLIAPEGVEDQNVKMGKTNLYRFCIDCARF
jgi:hypothetical protein